MGELIETKTKIANHSAIENIQMAGAAMCLVVGIDCSKLTPEEADSMTGIQMVNNLVQENAHRFETVKMLMGMDSESRKVRQELRQNVASSWWGTAGRVVTYLSTLSSDL